MAYKTFVVERTEDESTQTAGPATLNRADVPPLVKVFDDESDIVLSTLSTNEIVATKNTDYSSVAIVDRVAEGNLNPVTSNAVANALSYSTDETLTGAKWIDGKPIYRKVFILSTPVRLEADQAIDIAITNPTMYDTLVSSIFSGYRYDNASNPVSNSGFVFVNKINSTLHTMNKGFDFYLVNVGVEYTKTTD